MIPQSCWSFANTKFNSLIHLDGFSYERAALEEWFERGKITSPMTNLEISSEMLDNTVLRERIEEYLREMDFNSFDFEQKEEM